MEKHTIKIALFEDNPADARLIKEFFREAGSISFELECFARLEDGLERVRDGGHDIILLDLSLPDSQGIDTFLRARSINPTLPIVVLTGLADDDVALRAVQEGAQDYLIKGELNSSLLKKAIRYAIERNRIEEELRRARDELEIRVGERTAALEKANESLRLEIAERVKAEDEGLRLEQQLRQAQKMEALGTLAGGIAHDVNNIIATIMGQTEMGLCDLGVADPLRENFEIIMQACNRARDLANGILAFSRRKEGKLKPVVVDVIIDDAIRLIRASVPSTIRISRNTADSAKFTKVLADPSQLHQVILNLCSNAAHAMRDKGGTLHIGLARVDVNAGFMADHPEITRPGPYLQLSVVDTGHGIAPSIMDKIFDPFFTTKESSEGTGMGLAMVYGIVRGHGGAIIVRSEEGKGASFQVLLPVIEDGALCEKELCSPVPKGEGRILLVDDERPLLETARGLLTRLGYEVTADTDSRKILMAFKNQPEQYDLLVTDQTMPGLTGVELAKEVMETRPEMPVILYTGYGELISAEEAERLGIRGFLSKPFTMKDLAEAVQNALKRS